MTDKAHPSKSEVNQDHNAAPYGSHRWQDEVIAQTWNDPKALAKDLANCAIRNNSPQGASELLRVADERHHDSGAWVNSMHKACDAIDGSLWENLAIGHMHKSGFFQHEDSASLLKRTALESSQLDAIGRDPNIHGYAYDHQGLWGRASSVAADVGASALGPAGTAMREAYKTWDHANQSRVISQNDIDARYADMRVVNQGTRQHAIETYNDGHVNRVLDEQIAMGATHRPLRQVVMQTTVGHQDNGSVYSAKVQSVIDSGILTPEQKKAMLPLAHNEDLARQFFTGTPRG